MPDEPVSAPRPVGSIGEGLLFVFLLHPVQLLFLLGPRDLLDVLALIWMVQLAYVIPALIVLAAKRRWRTLLGVVIAAVISGIASGMVLKIYWHRWFVEIQAL